MIRKNTHSKLVRTALKRANVQKAYDAFEEEYSLLEEMLKARKKAGKSQSEIAQAMGTTTSVIGRLETGGGKKRHSPTIDTLKRYAHALGCVLRIQFFPVDK